MTRRSDVTLQVTALASEAVVAIENDTYVPAVRLADFDVQGRLTRLRSGDCPLTTSVIEYFVLAVPPVAWNWTLRAEESVEPHPASRARAPARKATALGLTVVLQPHRRSGTERWRPASSYHRAPKGRFSRYRC
jgi:hypothetical protein